MSNIRLLSPKGAPKQVQPRVVKEGEMHKFTFRSTDLIVVVSMAAAMMVFVWWIMSTFDTGIIARIIVCAIVGLISFFVSCFAYLLFLLFLSEKREDRFVRRQKWLVLPDEFWEYYTAAYEGKGLAATLEALALHFASVKDELLPAFHSMQSAETAINKDYLHTYLLGEFSHLAEEALRQRSAEQEARSRELREKYPLKASASVALFKPER